MASSRVRRLITGYLELIAMLAAAVLGLPVQCLAVTVWPGGWWLDPVIGLGIAAVSVREGVGSWCGDECC